MKKTKRWEKTSRNFFSLSRKFSFLFPDFVCAQQAPKVGFVIRGRFAFRQLPYIPPLQKKENLERRCFFPEIAARVSNIRRAYYNTSEHIRVNGGRDKTLASFLCTTYVAPLGARPKKGGEEGNRRRSGQHPLSQN